MMFKTKTEVTIVMSGHEADELAVWMHANNACGDKAKGGPDPFQSAIAGQLLRRLRDLPPTGEITT